MVPENSSPSDGSRLVLLVTNIPTPYRIPLFNEVARLLKEHGFLLKVVFGAWGYARRKWQIDADAFEFDYEILPSRRFYIGKNESVSLTYGGLFGVLRRERPMVTIITGYSLGTVKLWLRNLAVRTPYVIWSGAIETEGGRLSALRILQRRLLIRSAVGFLAYGSRAKRYLERLGAERDRIAVAINTVDTAFYRDRAVERRAGPDSSSGNTLLCLGDLSARKRVHLALRAVKHLSSLRQDFLLRVVGDGAERAALEGLARDLEISHLVQFDGYKQKDEVADVLASTRCLLFPTAFDIWGLVMVEAMAAGVPCIASVEAGATEDLIEDGVTGFAMDFSDVAAVAEKIAWLFDHPGDAHKMGGAASAFIRDNASVRRSAGGFLKAVKSVTAAQSI